VRQAAPVEVCCMQREFITLTGPLCHRGTLTRPGCAWPPAAACRVKVPIPERRS